MKTITLTLNEALVLIAEGMTMNNVKSLANKLRNADAPVNPQFTQYDLEKAKAQSKTWEQSYHDAMVNLDKAKQTESTLRAEISNLETYIKQDAELVKCFRKWVEELRVATDADKGLATAGVFSQAVQMIKESNRLGDRVIELESRLNKANDVISTVKTAYDHEGWTQHKAVCEIVDTVEAYYRGN